jgi:glycosyltransferase involved in cell wall biosynthesis
MASRKDSTSASVPHSHTSIEEPPLVSVVVPAHNAEPFIGELLASVLAQTYRHLEVLVLDDGSTDATSHVVAQHACDARLKHSRSETNIGVNKATSRLLKQVRGDYWAHPGADDVLEKDFIARRVALMERNPNAFMAYGAASYIDQNSHTIASPYPALEIPHSMSGEKALSVLLQHNIINTPSVLIRSEATGGISKYFETDWRYAQDWYLWLLLAANKGDLLYDDAKLHRYRIHGGSLTNDPAKSATKRLEIRLVPLCALAACASYSVSASDLWQRWRDSLYDLYLARACRVALSGCPLDQSLSKAASAHIGRDILDTSLPRELLRRSFRLWRTLLAESEARKGLKFPVAGLAAIDDPLFRL